MFPLEEGFGEPWFPSRRVKSYHLFWLMLWGGFWLGRYALVGTILEPIAASGDGDDFGVMEQAVEDGTGGGDVAQEFPHSSMGRLEVIRVERFS